MDLKHFKKTSEAPDHTMLSHPDGHQIKVLHAKLDKGELKKLKALPMNANEGGEQLESPDTRAIPQAAKDDEARRQQEDANQKERYGSPLRQTMPEGTTHLKAGQRLYFPDGGEVPEAEEVPVTPPVPQQAPQQQQMSPMVDYSQQLQADINQQKQGIQQKANAVGAQGNAEANRISTATGVMEQDEANTQGKLKDLNDERYAAYQDYKNGHIDPNAYFADKDAAHPFNEGHSKIATAIGLILGGIAGRGQGNVALDFLNKNIDRNIAAQTAEMNKKTNAMTMLTQQFGNVKDAAAMHSVFQRDILADRLQEEAAKAKNPIAQSEALQAKGALQAQNEALMAQTKWRQGIIKGMQAGTLPPESGVQALVEPAHQQKVYESLGKVRSLNSMQQDMDANAQQLHQKLMQGVLSPKDTEAMVMQYAGPLQHIAEGRYNKEGAEQQIRNLMPTKLDTPATARHKDVLRAQFFHTLRADHEPVLVGNNIPVPKPAASANTRNYRAGRNK